ncbi:DUF2935 domain-containing protein [Sporomusa malonica]|uniref:DUF2935 domain-containing protein n=1 Tax=Sporomusa malonica TaxID=112901 RepID=A0A1W2EHF1_9FIRM|nr:DUF2935 domain-containing protein [Sporomusa malonica]SMD09130.1 protein of unknown function [Sporomusa malonica]
MPRHSSGTGNVLPVPPLDIEEVKFWLHIMEEHALFIKTGLPFDQTDLIEEASAFEREFKALRVRAEKLHNEKKFAELIADTMASLKEFIRYKSLLLGMSMTNKLGSALPPLFFDHIIREAEYFMAILEKIRAGKKLAVVKAQEADFWLRIMADHTKFIGSRLDPSERSLRGVVEGYEVEFDDLSMQSRDYVSFFEHKPMDLPAFNRFLQDSRAATMRLRDFKQAAYDMVIANRMLSTIPAALADHVRREAEHFLLVLAMIEKGIIKVEKDCVDMKYKHNTKYGMIVDEEVVDSVETADFVVAEEVDERDYVAEEEVIDDIELDYTPDNGREKVLPNIDSLDGNDISKEDPGEIKAKYQIKAEVIPEVAVEVPPQPTVAPKTEKKSKYKWGDNWPRQLGKVKA